MSTYFLAAASTPPSPPPVSPAQELRTSSSYSWTAWDGSVWSLNGDQPTGVRLLRGLRGPGMGTYQRHTSVSPAVAGSRWRGYRAEEREVFLPVGIWHDGSSQDWIDYDAAFWATLHPDRPGLLTITQPGGVARSLRLRYVSGGDEAADIDPALLGWASYGIYMVAEQPFWEGAPVERTFSGAEGQPFFPAGGGPPFHISSGSTLARASITNPGHVESALTWTARGPWTTLTVGVADRNIELLAPIPDGESVTINTGYLTATAQSVIHSPSGDNWIRTPGLVGAADWNGSHIPAGGTVPLAITGTGTGSVTASLTPYYHRARS